MAIPNGALHIVASGTLPGGEAFAWGSWFDAGTGKVQADIDAILGTWVAAFNNTYGVTYRGMIPSTAAYTQVRAYYYTGGSTAAVVSQSGLTGVGTGATAPLPNQCCLVVTLMTGRPGRRYRGRIYLPFIGAALTSGQLTSAQCTTYANAVAGHLSAVKDANGTGGFQPANPAVMSSVVSALTPITQVRVDSKIDIQRRRAEKQVASFSATGAVT